MSKYEICTDPNAVEGTNYFVTFRYPGSFMSESSRQCVKSRDPKTFDIPPRAYSFFVSTIEIFKVESPSGERILMEGKPTDVSGENFINAEVLTYDEIVSSMTAKSILAGNMKSNGWMTVAKTRFGQYFPFQENDKIFTV